MSRGADSRAQSFSPAFTVSSNQENSTCDDPAATFEPVLTWKLPTLSWLSRKVLNESSSFMLWMALSKGCGVGFPRFKASLRIRRAGRVTKFTCSDTHSFRNALCVCVCVCHCLSEETEDVSPWVAAGAHCWGGSAPRWFLCSYGSPSGSPSSVWTVWQRIMFWVIISINTTVQLTVQRTCLGNMFVELVMAFKQWVTALRSDQTTTLNNSPCRYWQPQWTVWPIRRQQHMC